MGFDEMCLTIIKSGMKPVVRPWMKIPRAAHSHIILMDSLPKLRTPGGAIINKYLLQRIGELDFWNEWEGFASINHNVTVYDARTSEWEFPAHPGIKRSSDTYNPVQNAGDRIVLKDGSVYVVYGFNHKDGSASIYFNTK